MFDDALQMLTTLFATVSIGLIELRPIRPGGPAMPAFYPVAQIEHVAARAIDLRDHADVYFGVAPRAEEASGKAAIACVQAVWVDLDPDSPGVADRHPELPARPVDRGQQRQGVSRLLGAHRAGRRASRRTAQPWSGRALWDRRARPQRRPDPPHSGHDQPQGPK
jgi:hypothetical protein